MKRAANGYVADGVGTARDSKNGVTEMVRRLNFTGVWRIL
jgi:hypothetical protein